MSSRARIPLVRFSPDTATLVRRATFGPDGEIERSARAVGWSAFVEQQLHPETIDDDQLQSRLASAFPESALSAKESLDFYSAPAKSTRAAVLLRAVHSRRQVFERVVESWNDHFNIDSNSGECRVLKSYEDRTAIRAHALGSFRDLLESVTRSAAMLEYLDNRRNGKVAPNENFARELLELHTLGVGEYDETDVREVARCFTGWTMRPREDERFGDFVFDAAEHDDGAKSVLGHSIPAQGGERDGHIVLDLVARHPATARRVALKMCRAFVAERPPARVVDAVACAFSDSDGDGRATMRAVLRPESFAVDAESPADGTRERDHAAAASAKYLRPFHLVVAILRATRASITDARGLLDELATLGDAPFTWPTPDGPPDRRAWWESSMLSRWRFVERYMQGEIPGVAFDPEVLLARSSGADVVSRLDGVLTGGRMSAADRAVLQRHAASFAALDTSALRRLLTLTACAPSFQVV